MIRLLGLGDNTVDTYVNAGVQFPGGNAVNLAVFAARQGAKAGYLGCVGDDAGGRLVLESLAAEGVDTSRCRTRPGANARALIGHAAGERRFLSAHPGVRADYRLDEADRAWIAGWDHVHTSINSDIDNALPAGARSLSYDFSDKWTDARLDAMVPLLDVAVLSCAERGRDAAEAALQRCAGLGVKIAIATLGPAGALALAEGHFQEQPPLPTNVVDTLGAGDGFIAGFLIAWLAGRDMPAALAEAAGFAAEVCTWQGAFGHASPWINET